MSATIADVRESRRLTSASLRWMVAAGVALAGSFASLDASKQLSHGAKAMQPVSDSGGLVLLTESLAVLQVGRVCIILGVLCLAVSITLHVMGVRVAAREVATKEDLSGRLSRLVGELAAAERDLREHRSRADELSARAQHAATLLATSGEQLAAIQAEVAEAARPGTRLGWLGLIVGIVGIGLSIAFYVAA